MKTEVHNQSDLKTKLSLFCSVVIVALSLEADIISWQPSKFNLPSDEFVHQSDLFKASGSSIGTGYITLRTSSLMVLLLPVCSFIDYKKLADEERAYSDVKCNASLLPGLTWVDVC